MSEKNKTQLSRNEKIRTHWDEEQDKWFFSIQDVIQTLSESKDIKQYIKKMRSRDLELNANWGTICTLVGMRTADGKFRKIQASDMEGIFRIIQSVPSPKAEHFRTWLAKVGTERLEEIEDPDIAFDRAMETYLKKGYSKEWVNQRLKNIEVRKELADEWEERGMEKGLDYTILVNELTKAWTGKSLKDYNKDKGLKIGNLRDDMSNLEIVLNMLAEASATEISKEKQPKGLNENKDLARKYETIAKKARLEIEKQMRKPIVSFENYLNRI